jgi:TPR repeat protein
VRGSLGALAAAVIGVFLAGCAAERLYAGPARPPHETALVVTNAVELAQVESIDGTAVSSAADRYEVLPGWHTIRVRGLPTGGTAPRNLEHTSLVVEAEPGHAYRLRGARGAASAQWMPRLDDADPVDLQIPARDPADMERQCRAGRVTDCIQLGALCERGTLEVEWDEARAAILYERACVAHHPAGCFHLAAMYESGHGVDRDERFAANLFKEACAAGEPRACTHLGLLMEEGRGQPKDGRGAVALFEQACGAGEPAACTRMGFLARESRAGRAADYGRAVELFEKACALGEPQGCSGLGLMYEGGLGVEQDGLRAASLYAKACEGGWALGCANLGVIYQLGLGGVGKDQGRAAELFRKACARGVATACSSLATFSPRSVDPANRLTYEVAPLPAAPEVSTKAPEPVPEPPVAPPKGACPEYTVTGTHVRTRICPEPSGEKQPPPSSSGFQLGVRGEGNLLQPAFVAGISAELGDWFSAVATLILRTSPGFRLEGRFYPLRWTRWRLYAAFGGSIFAPAVSGRVALGADVQVLDGLPLHVSGDLALEHFFTGDPEYEPDYALLSIGAGWRF